MIKNKALETIREYKMLEPSDSVLIGVSGGADSISLLYVLVALKDEIGLSSICVAHLNHMMRKEEAELDQRYVENIAKNLGLLCLSESVDVEAYAAQNKLSIEDAGRTLRYLFYNESAKKIGANKIALGHNADDMVETFLMRLLRGAGLKGLTGIPPVRNNIIRPLIRIWRREIETYIASLKLVPRIDHTNYESKYLRNRVRLKLIPQLKIYNINIKDILLQTVSLLTEDYLYMEAKTKEALSAVVTKESEDKIELDAKKLRELESRIVGHLIRIAIEKVKGNLSEMSFSHIHNILKNLDSTERWENHLPGHIFITGSKTNLVITKDKPEEFQKTSFHYTLAIPGEIIIKEANVKISVEIVNEVKNIEETGNTALLDFDEVGKEIVIRSRKSGDRFFPLGMNCAKKIQDFFVDLKIPIEKRDLIPIIESAERIVWIAGYRIDERVKVTKKTRKAVKLSCQSL